MFLFVADIQVSLHPECTGNS